MIQFGLSVLQYHTIISNITSPRSKSNTVLSVIEKRNPDRTPSLSPLELLVKANSGVILIKLTFDLCVTNAYEYQICSNDLTIIDPVF